MLKKIFFLLKLTNIKKFFFLILISFQTLIDLAGVGLIFPLTKYLINEDKNQKLNLLNFDFNINYFIFIIILLFLLKFLFSIFLNYKILIFGKKIKVNLQERLISQYQNFNYLNYLTKERSYYLFKTETLTKKFSDLIISLTRMFAEIFVAIFIIIFLGFLNVKFLLIIILFFILSVFIFDLIFKRRLFYLGKISNNVYSKMLKSIYDIFDGYLDIKIFNKEKYFLSRAINSSYKASVTEAKIEIIPISAKYYLELIIILLFSLSVFVFLTFQSTDNLVQSLPLIITFGVAAIKLMPIFNTFVRTGSLLRSNKNSIDILFKDFNNFEKIKKTKKNFKKQDKSIKEEKFRNLTINSLNFSFQKKKILVNVNLSINKNDFVGIIGSSGSGKTSLVNLICGVYENYKGDIFVNNSNLKDALPFWKKKISYIPQTPFLTDDSVKKNILFDDNKMNKKIFDQSIKKSRLDNFLYQNKSGADYKIGDKGSKISGGQKQRILIARSFYHNREIIVFDESTSALDQDVENKILEDIKKLKGNFTGIFISHNKNILKICNKIYEIKNKKLNLIKNE